MCSNVQMWRTKLVLSVVLVLFIGSSAHSLYIEDGNRIISDERENYVQHGGVSVLREEARQQQGGGTTQGRHRLKMLFPLLLRIASRLAQIVPMALAAMAATFIMAALAKKAFIISLAAFALMLYETFKKKGQKHHYVVESPEEHHVIENHYVSTNPYEHPEHSNHEYNSHWNKYYGGQNVYEGSSSNIVKNIQPPRNHVLPVRGNIGPSGHNRYINNNYIPYVRQ